MRQMPFQGNFQGGDDSSDDDDDIDEKDITQSEWGKLIYVFPPHVNCKPLEVDVVSGKRIVPCSMRKKIIRSIQLYRDSGKVPENVAVRFRKAKFTKNFLKRVKLHHLLYRKERFGTSDEVNAAAVNDSRQFNHYAAAPSQSLNALSYSSPGDATESNFDDASSPSFVSAGGKYIMIITRLVMR